MTSDPADTLDSEIAAVKARLEQMDPVEQEAAYNRLLRDLANLEERRI